MDPWHCGHRGRRRLGVGDGHPRQDGRGSGLPGEEAFPPQPMVAQIRKVLEAYRAAGGRIQIEMFEGSGHGPVIDAAERWSEIFFAFLASADVKAVGSRA